MKLWNKKHIDFLLKEVFPVSNLASHEYFSAHDASSVDMILHTAEDLAQKYLIPYFKETDIQPAELKDGQVYVHDAVKKFVKAYGESGFTSASFPAEEGGLQVPSLVMAGVHYILLAGHNAILMYTDLIKGCVNLIRKFGNEEQQSTFIPKMLACQWLGTMCLTEPEAGSSLAGIRTQAQKKANGAYSIKGHKIFISAGDHDAADNIIHLVLARVAGAPEGVKGISLFIVPKYKIENPGQSNDVQTVGIFHKMGQKSTPAAHLVFGEKEDCEGYLLGEENRGLSQMFQMMNSARLGVGLTGIAMMSAAYEYALEYAGERVQGKSLLSRQEVPILNHPDVRRMLLSQKAMHHAGLALHLQCYYYQDLMSLGVEVEKHKSLLDLLTPVAKTFGAEEGQRGIKNALQIFGGYGYTTDFPLEQLARDARILSIYEGTTGILSQSLLARQIIGTQQASLQVLWGEIKLVVTEAKNNQSLKEMTLQFEAAWEELVAITDVLASRAANDNMEAAVADATLYMEYFALIVAGWQCLKMTSAALDHNEHREELHHLTHYFFTYEFVKTHSLYKTLISNDALTSESQKIKF